MGIVKRVAMVFYEIVDGGWGGNEIFVRWR